jgi:hypothetical protein
VIRMPLYVRIKDVHGLDTTYATVSELLLCTERLRVPVRWDSDLHACESHLVYQRDGSG